MPYDLYIGKTLNSYGSSFDENKENNFNFDEIVNSLSYDMYEAESFTADEIGKLYYFEIKPITHEGIDFTVDFIYDQEKILIALTVMMGMLGLLLVALILKLIQYGMVVMTQYGI